MIYNDICKEERGSEMDKMYSVKEVAEILGVTEGTVRNYLTKGKINHVKVLGNTRIKETELKGLIKPSKKEEEE